MTRKGKIPNSDNRKTNEESEKDLKNEDPISGAPGSHPVGTGVGAALGGAAVGALAGAVAGPAGVAVGVVAGAVAGGYGGKAVSESIDPTVELEYWKKNFSTRDYHDPNIPFEEYEPAYRFAVENYRPNRQFEDCKEDLRLRWEAENPHSKLSWDRVELVGQDAWHRISGRQDAWHRNADHGNPGHGNAGTGNADHGNPGHGNAGR